FDSRRHLSRTGALSGNFYDCVHGHYRHSPRCDPDVVCLHIPRYPNGFLYDHGVVDPYACLRPSPLCVIDDVYVSSPCLPACSASVLLCPPLSVSAQSCTLSSDPLPLHQHSSVAPAVPFPP